MQVIVKSGLKVGFVECYCTCIQGRIQHGCYGCFSTRNFETQPISTCSFCTFQYCRKKLRVLNLSKLPPTCVLGKRISCCTSWVKRWSEAMDFLQTIFKTNIFLLRILEIYTIKGQTYHPPSHLLPEAFHHTHPLHRLIIKFEFLESTISRKKWLIDLCLCDTNYNRKFTGKR